MPGLSCFDAEAASLTKSVVVILRPPEGMDATLKPLLAELGHLLQGCCDKSPQSLRLQVQARACSGPGASASSSVFWLSEWREESK